MNICVPKRLLSQEQAELLRGILEKHAPAAEIKCLIYRSIIMSDFNNQENNNRQNGFEREETACLPVSG